MSEENKKQTEEKEEIREPISIMIEKAKRDISIAVLKAQRTYGLPSYITALIVEATLADVRAGKNVDMVADFEQYKGALTHE